LIVKAEKPIFYVGGGIIFSKASEELRTLAETIIAPVTTTLMGMSAFPTAHPLVCWNAWNAWYKICKLCHPGI